MNELTFYIDEYESVKQCVYKERIKGFDSIYTKIVLPDKELHNLFVKFQRANSLIKPRKNNEMLVFSYYDVDVDEIDKLIERTKVYYEYLRNVNSQNNLRQEALYTRKINRINKFKRTTISVSMALILALNGFLAYKNTTKSNNNNFINEENTDSSLDETNLEKIIYDDEFNTVILTEDEINSDIPQMIDNSNLDSDSTLDGDMNTDSIENMDDKIIEEEKNIDFVFNFSADDYTNTKKYLNSNAYYSQAIEKYAGIYGIDPTLALAVATQESGYHRDTVNYGGAIGLFQIQVEGDWNWNGRQIEAYNFETKQFDSVIITTESVSDVFENIRVGCMMLQNLVMKYNYNIAKAITAYNYGETYVANVINRCSQETGISVDDLSSMDCLDWLDYREIIANGDSSYLENVFKYVPNDTVLNFKKINGETINILYQNTLSHSNKHTF